MVNYARVATHIDRGNGKAAQKLGQPYLSYRVESGSAGDFPAGWGLLPTIPANYPIFKRKLASETKAEIAVKNAAQWFELIGDMTPFLLGDIFVQNDPAYNPGVSYGAGATLLSDTLQFNAICFAWHDPVKRRLGARLDRLAGIYRPAASPKTLPDDSL